MSKVAEDPKAKRRAEWEAEVAKESSIRDEIRAIDNTIANVPELQRRREELASQIAHIGFLKTRLADLNV